MSEKNPRIKSEDDEEVACSCGWRGMRSDTLPDYVRGGDDQIKVDVCPKCLGLSYGLGLSDGLTRVKR